MIRIGNDLYRIDDKQGTWYIWQTVKGWYALLNHCSYKRYPAESGTYTTFDDIRSHFLVEQ